MLVQFLFKARPVLLNLLFIVYLLVAQPGIMARLAVSQKHGGDWPLAYLLMLIPLLEIMGIALKRPVAAYFARYYPKTGGGAYLVAAYLVMAIFHIGLAVFLVVVAFQVGGGRPTGDQPGATQMAMFGVGFAILIKETFLVVLAYPADRPLFGAPVFPNPRNIFERVVGYLTADQTPPQITLKVFLVDLLGSLLLLAFSAIAYTALWEFFFTRSGQIDPLSKTIAFPFIYLPLSFVSFMEELAIEISPRQRIISLASTAAVWLFAVLA